MRNSTQNGGRMLKMISSAPKSSLILTKSIICVTPHMPGHWQPSLILKITSSGAGWRIMAQHCCVSYTMSTSLKYCPIALYQIQASLHPFSHPCTNWEPPHLPHPIQQRSSSHAHKGVLATNIQV